MRKISLACKNRKIENQCGGFSPLLAENAVVIMVPHARRASLTFLLSFLLAAPLLSADVKDEASFFNTAMLKQANDEIKDIKDMYKKDLIVETFKTVPVNKVNQVKGMKADERIKFFSDWLKDGARQSGTDGIHVLILDTATVKVISPASYWEIAIRISIGKYTLQEPYDSFMQKNIIGNGFEILQIEPRHTAVLTTLPFHHRDPIDRLLIAQAMVEKIPILSSDATIDAYSVSRLW